jgi:hypothetical protein
VYEDEGYLWEALEKLNITDLHIVLNDEGYAVWRETPALSKHDTAVDVILMKFAKWKEEQGAVLFDKQNANVFFLQASRGTRNVAQISPSGVPTDWMKEPLSETSSLEKS